MSSFPGFKPEAAAEVEEAFLWYESQSLGLGTEFLRSLEACLAHIQRFPLAASEVHHSMRRAILHRFPYGVFYLSSEGKLTVYAVFHFSRDPVHLAKRSPSRK